MEVTCPACAARYTADEEKLRGKTARMRCRACDTVWMVAGPEETTGSGEAKRVKRGADRENRDLFATREPDLGCVPSTMRPPPPTDGMGARNETSVLFTVASLKGTARVKTPEPSEAPPPSSMRPMMEDDEGVIDLNALATVPPKPGARPVAPLFSEPPPAAFARDASPSSSSDLSGHAGAGAMHFSKRMMVGIGAAAVAVVLMGIGVAAAFKGEEPVARAQATMVAPVTPPAPATAAPKPPEPAPAPAASTSSSSSDDDKDSKPAKKAGKKKNMSGGGGGAKIASGVSKSPNMSKVSSSGVAPVKPAADKCGCKGDFNCILRCTATGK